jgi:hypothetical protein
MKKGVLMRLLLAFLLLIPLLSLADDGKESADFKDDYQGDVLECDAPADLALYLYHDQIMSFGGWKGRSWSELNVTLGFRSSQKDMPIHVLASSPTEGPLFGLYRITETKYTYVTYEKGRPIATAVNCFWQILK